MKPYKFSYINLSNISNNFNVHLIQSNDHIKLSLLQPNNILCKSQLK